MNTRGFDLTLTNLSDDQTKHYPQPSISLSSLSLNDYFYAVFLVLFWWESVNFLSLHKLELFIVLNHSCFSF